MKYLYKMTDGKVEAKLFDLDENPKGWVDDPAKAKKPKKKPAKKAK